MHWHIAGHRRGMGTVEVTYLPSIGKLTVSVHDNRRGFWAGRVYEKLVPEIEEQAKPATSASCHAEVLLGAPAL